MNRRQFLRTVGGATAGAALPWGAMPHAQGATPAQLVAARDLTTLGQTLRPGAASDLGYRPVRSGPGERHAVREELAKAAGGRQARRSTLLSFVHLTDQHIIDVQSPTRVEFLDRYADNECEPFPFSSAYRPQEAACARVADAMLRKLRRIKVSPVTGAPFAAAICTGDNTDNQQLNELELFMGVMNGGPVKPDSGDPKRYEGVQVSGDLSYWHPDPAVEDFYKQRRGFPSRKGWLEGALGSFEAVGAGMPWFTCYGNHDGLAQGNAPVNPGFERIGTGGTKVVGLPPGANPCEQFGGLGIPAGAPVQPTTPDPDRRYVSRREWIARHLKTTGKPIGHGFTQDNVDKSLAYYATDVGPIRFITLDTVNPGGLDSGSIGETQLVWLEERLKEAQDERRLVMLFSHHGLRSLDNPNEAPDPLNPDQTDLPRRRADEVLARIGPFSCVIAWVNGHSHENVIEPKASFWDVGTSAHIDWPAQARIIDVVDNNDGTLSLFTTMFDHEDGEIVSFARELALNDHQRDASKSSGRVEDRNTELLLKHPFAGGGGGGGGAGGAGGGRGGGGGPLLPATGGGAAFSAGGALAVAAGLGLWRLREGRREH